MDLDTLIDKVNQNRRKIADIKKFIQDTQPENKYLIKEIRSIEGFLAYLWKELNSIRTEE
jgi:predicted nuclease with TOPRIM domain